MTEEPTGRLRYFTKLEKKKDPKYVNAPEYEEVVKVLQQEWKITFWGIESTEWRDVEEVFGCEDNLP